MHDVELRQQYLRGVDREDPNRDLALTALDHELVEINGCRAGNTHRLILDGALRRAVAVLIDASQHLNAELERGCLNLFFAYHLGDDPVSRGALGRWVLAE